MTQILVLLQKGVTKNVPIDTLNWKLQFNGANGVLFVSHALAKPIYLPFSNHTQYCSHDVEIIRFNILEYVKIACGFEPYSCNVIKYTKKYLHVKLCLVTFHYLLSHYKSYYIYIYNLGNS